MRGDQEEEEAEDEISSHKTVVTKFLNKVTFLFAFYWEVLISSTLLVDSFHDLVTRQLTTLRHFY